MPDMEIGLLFFLTLLNKKAHYIQKNSQLLLAGSFLFVIRMGFEPMTHSLEGCCSIQLSYPTILNCGAKVVLLFVYTNSKVFFFIRRDNRQQNARQNYLANSDSE